MPPIERLPMQNPAPPATLVKCQPFGHAVHISMPYGQGLACVTDYRVLAYGKCSATVLANELLVPVLASAILLHVRAAACRTHPPG